MTVRIRSIHPGFFVDEDIADLPEKVQLFYIGLWTHADRAGRLEDRPKRLKTEIRSYDAAFDADEALAILARPKKSSGQPYIVRYVVNDQRYIQILTWSKYQRPHLREKESEIPPPPHMHRAGTVPAPGEHESSTPVSCILSLVPGSLSLVSGNGNGVRGRGEPEEIAPPAPIQGSGQPPGEPPADLLSPPLISKGTLRELIKVKGREWVLDYLKAKNYPIPEFMLEAGNAE